MRFSQLGFPSEDSLVDQGANNRQKWGTMKLNSTVFSYFITAQPQGWYRKEITYFMPNNRRETQVFERPFTPVPEESQTYHTELDPVTSEKTFMRESFGSSNSRLSNLKSPTSTHSFPIKGSDFNNIN